jgi:hypothetical protein
VTCTENADVVARRGEHEDERGDWDGDGDGDGGGGGGGVIGDEVKRERER